jgi:hypothetical protein
MPEEKVVQTDLLVIGAGIAGVPVRLNDRKRLVLHQVGIEMQVETVRLDCTCCYGAIGNDTVNVEPSPGLLVTSILPLCPCTMP